MGAQSGGCYGQAVIPSIRNGRNCVDGSILDTGSCPRSLFWENRDKPQENKARPTAVCRRTNHHRGRSISHGAFAVGLVGLDELLACCSTAEKLGGCFMSANGQRMARRLLSWELLHFASRKKTHLAAQFADVFLRGGVDVGAHQ